MKTNPFFRKGPRRKAWLALAWYLTATLLFIVVLAHYRVVYPSTFTMGDFFADPEQYAGINRSITGPYAGPAEGGFYLTHNQKQVRIYFEQQHTPPRLGEVNVYGKLQSDGSLQAYQAHNYDYNYLLYVVSFFAGLAVLLLLFREWKVTGRGLESRDLKVRGDGEDA